MLPTVQQATGSLAADTNHVLTRAYILGIPAKIFAFSDSPFSPLLKEKRHPCRRALIAYRSHPVGMEGPRSGACLAAENDTAYGRCFQVFVT